MTEASDVIILIQVSVLLRVHPKKNPGKLKKHLIQ